MNKAFVYAVVGLAFVGRAAAAQEVTQSLSSVGYSSATVQSPAGTDTKVVTAEAPSRMGRLGDGTKIEMDSDDSVHVVYPDGARVAAPDGMHTLASGQVITVKEGKLIP